MGYRINENKTSIVPFQSGSGVPSHLSPRGTVYVDNLTGTEYINKDGFNTWAYLYDSTMSISGGTGSGGTVTGAYLPLSGGTVYGPAQFTGGLSANTLSNINYANFLTAPTVTFASGGTLFFDSTTNSLAYKPITNNNDVTINIGQESLIRIYNNTGLQINNGQALHITGSTLEVPTVTLAIAAGGSNTYYQVDGVATHDILNNEYGFMTVFGVVNDINLTGFTLGDDVYLSQNIAGSFISYSGLSFTGRTSQIGHINDNGVLGKLQVNIFNESQIGLVTAKENSILISNDSSTGVYSYTGATVASTTTINVGPVNGWIVNNTYDYSTNPSIIPIFYIGGTNIPITNILTADATYLLISSAATLVQQTTFPTPKERRQNIFLGKVVHPNRSTILNINQTVDFDVSPMSAIRDIWTPIKLINQGVVPSAYSAGTMSMKTSAGTLWGNGVGWVTNELNPNSVSFSATNPTTFQYRTATGGTFSNTTSVDSSKYDPNGLGVITSVPGNNYTTQRIYAFPTGLIRIQYGQEYYPTQAKALAGLPSETYIEYINNRDNGILIGFLTVKAGMSDLTNTTDAFFTYVSKFGELFGGTAGISTTTLQQAYDNSTSPEIIINAVLDGVTIKNGTGNPDSTTHLIEGMDSSGVVTSFILGDGTYSGSTFKTPSVTANNNGLTATTISATTYYGLPLDIKVTGATYTAGTATFTNNTGGTFTLSGLTDGNNYLPLSGGTLTGIISNPGGAGYQPLYGSEYFGVGTPVLSLSGWGNSVFGAYALGLMSGLTSQYNTVIGNNALGSATGNMSYNTNIGMLSGYYQQVGNYNVGVGSYSLYGATGVTATGTGISWNVGIGNNTLLYITNGTVSNTAIGNAAMQGTSNISGITGSYNTAIGHQSLFRIISGRWNTGLGAFSLQLINTGSNNTALGYGSLSKLTTSSNNTAVGQGTLSDITTGTTNTAIGYNTGLGITTGDYNTILGSQVTGLAAGLSNTVIIADGQGNQRITVPSTGNVIIGNGLTDNGSKLQVNGSSYINGNETITGSLSATTISATTYYSNIITGATNVPLTVARYTKTGGSLTSYLDLSLLTYTGNGDGAKISTPINTTLEINSSGGGSAGGNGLYLNNYLTYLGGTLGTVAPAYLFVQQQITPSTSGTSTPALYNVGMGVYNSNQRNTVTLINKNNYSGSTAFEIYSDNSTLASNTSFLKIYNPSTTFLDIKGGTGNVLINTTTDAGYKLDVNGTFRSKSDINGAGVLNLGTTGSGATINLNRASTGALMGQIYQTNDVTVISNLQGTGLKFQVAGSDRILFQGYQAGTPNITSQGSITASGSIARGINIINTLLAATNNDVLVGLDVIPTFTIGAFTGTTSLAARFTGNIQNFTTTASTPTFQTFATGRVSINASGSTYPLTVAGTDANDINGGKIGILSNGAGTSGLILASNIGSGNPGIQALGTQVIHIASPINGTGGNEFLTVRKSNGATDIQRWDNFGGTARLASIAGDGTFNTLGNVFIGYSGNSYTGSTYKLEVNGHTLVNGTIASTNLVTSGGQIRFGNNRGYLSTGLSTGNSNGASLYSVGSTDLELSVDSGVSGRGIYINRTTGNVNIGFTGDTGYKLYVNGTSRFQSTILNTGTYGSTTIDSGNANGMIIVSGTGTNGGVGYTDFLKVTNTFSGATNPNKTFRLNSSGGLEIINSLYTGNTLTITDTGILHVGGTNTATVTNNDALTNFLSFNNNGSQIYDDGNLHIHSRGSNQSMWINTNGGQINLLTQTPYSGASLGSGIAIATGNLVGFVTINTGKTYTTATSYGYLTSGGAGTYPGGSQTVSVSLYATARVMAQEVDAYSDERMKDIHGEIGLDEAIKLVKEVKPIKFNWKDDESKSVKTGYSAQQTAKSGYEHLITLLPKEGLEEKTDDDGFVSPKDTQFLMNYDQVVPYHGRVIKYLLEKIESLEKEIQELKNKKNG